MSGSAGGSGAIDETMVFLDHFKGLPDPRQIGKVSYPRHRPVRKLLRQLINPTLLSSPMPSWVITVVQLEVLLLCLLAVLAGAECFTKIARFGDRKLAVSASLSPVP